MIKWFRYFIRWCKLQIFRTKQTFKNNWIRLRFRYLQRFAKHTLVQQDRAKYFNACYDSRKNIITWKKTKDFFWHKPLWLLRRFFFGYNPRATVMQQITGTAFSILKLIVSTIYYSVTDTLKFIIVSIWIAYEITTTIVAFTLVSIKFLILAILNAPGDIIYLASYAPQWRTILYNIWWFLSRYSVWPFINFFNICEWLKNFIKDSINSTILKIKSKYYYYIYFKYDFYKYYNKYHLKFRISVYIQYWIFSYFFVGIMMESRDMEWILDNSEGNLSYDTTPQPDYRLLYTWWFVAFDLGLDWYMSFFLAYNIYWWLMTFSPRLQYVVYSTWVPFFSVLTSTFDEYSPHMTFNWMYVFYMDGYWIHKHIVMIIYCVAMDYWENKELQRRIRIKLEGGSKEEEYKYYYVDSCWHRDYLFMKGHNTRLTEEQVKLFKRMLSVSSNRAKPVFYLW